MRRALPSLLLLCACSESSPVADAALPDASFDSAVILGEGGASLDASAPAIEVDAAASLPDLTAAGLGPIDAMPAPDGSYLYCPTGRWCSALYPPGWSATAPADSAGRFLHDFSYAGYRNGEAAIPDPAPGPVFDVVATYGADPTGARDATAAIQMAITAAGAAGGGVVHLPAGTYRLDGVLDIARSGVVLSGAGKDSTTLRFSRVQGMSYMSHISVHGALKAGPDIALALDGANRSTVVSVSDATGLAVGDDVSLGWVISDAFIAEHQMTGTWAAFNGTWRPFFRRRVVAIDRGQSPARVTLDVPLRYDARVRDQASLRRETGYLSGCGVEHLAIANAVKWSDAWAQHQVHAIGFEAVMDSWIRDVQSVQAPTATGASAADTSRYDLQSSGLIVGGSKRVTVADVTLGHAQNRGSGGDGYLFEISRSSEILVRDSVGRAGRHNFIQNWDFGTTGCVFLRCQSFEGANVTLFGSIAFGVPAFSEYHHSLAMANLVDESTLGDGFIAHNRGLESSGAGHTATESVVWNARGGGLVISKQFGFGYVIGTQKGMTIDASLVGSDAAGTAPADWVEGADVGDTLYPSSLYEHQHVLRTGH